MRYDSNLLIVPSRNLRDPDLQKVVDALAHPHTVKCIYSCVEGRHWEADRRTRVPQTSQPWEKGADTSSRPDHRAPGLTQIGVRGIVNPPAPSAGAQIPRPRSGP